MLRLLRVAALALVGSLAAGSARAIDPFFPSFGNNGIDVIHYTLDLDVRPTTGRLEAWAVLEILAEKDLVRFSLDLHKLVASKVTVNGAPARFSQANDKLTVTPRRTIHKHSRFRVYITYSGVPDPIPDPTTPGFELGWFKDGNASYVVSEPVGASTFFPANDEPTDKARFTIAVTVPSPYFGVSNGALTSFRKLGDKRRFVWQMRQPMTTWLATVHVNRFRIKFARSPSGIPVTVFATAATPPSDIEGHALAARMLPFFERLIGRYPFETYGAVVVDDPGLVYALETQTISTFPIGWGDERTVAHELAHQWFGNSASVAKWEDLWIAEGTATYFEILWPHRNDPAGFDAEMQARYENLDGVGPAVVDDPEDMFTERTYERGALTLYALRQTVGDKKFFRILAFFAAAYKGRNATSADFINVAEAVSGDPEVRPLLRAWLYGKKVPPLPGGVAAASAQKPAPLLPQLVGLRCGRGAHRGSAQACN